MSAKWNVLQLGARIRLKGETSADDIDGVITSYFSGEDNTIKGYIFNPDDKSRTPMPLTSIPLALDDKFEILKQIIVKCPWCSITFPIEIENKYKGANAIPQDGNQPLTEGFDYPCPNCTRQLFIHCYR